MRQTRDLLSTLCFTKFRKLSKHIKKLPYIEFPNKVPNKLLKAFPDIQVMAWNVYALLSTNGYQTTTQMATVLGISDRMVRKHLTTLKEKGLIVRTGSNKTGHWEIVKT